MKAEHFRDLAVYQRAFTLQQAIFDLSKTFPVEEKYSLTDQIRRSSRSVGANIAEAWSKRRYPAHFVSKLSDSDGELAETIHWLDSALACGYLSAEVHGTLIEDGQCIGSMIGKMMSAPKSWGEKLRR